MNELQGLVVPIEARIDKLEKALVKANRAQQKSAQTMERRAKRSARNMARTYDRMGTDVAASFKRMAVPLIAGIASVQTVRTLHQTVKGVAALGDEAKRSGVGLKAFQEWRFIAEQNRISVDSMVDGLKELNLRADEFGVTGKGPAAEAFARLGYGADQMADKLKDPSKFLLQIIGRMEKLSKSGQIRVADEIFGGSAGERFVELIDRGESGLRDTIDRAHDLGIVLDESVIARADELDRKFNALLNKVSSVGKRLAVASADLAVAMVTPTEDPFAGLKQSYDGLLQKANFVAEQMNGNADKIAIAGYGEVADQMDEFARRTYDLAKAFGDNTIEGEEFAKELENIQTEAQAALNRLDDVDKAQFGSVTGALDSLAAKLAEVFGVASGLKSVLDAINNQSSPKTDMNVFREADAESMKDYEAGKKRLNDFLTVETTRNSLSRERLNLEREIVSVQKAAKDSGAFLTNQQAAAAAQARIMAQNLRRENTSTTSDTNSGGGGSRSSSDWDSEIISIAEETAALRLEAQALLGVTDAQARRGNAMDLARTKANLLNAAMRSGLSDSPALRSKVDALANEYIKASEAAETAADKIQSVQEASQRGASDVASVFTQMATGAISAKEAVGQLILQIVQLTIKKRILAAIEKADGGGGGFLGSFLKILGGGFASGGYTGNGGKYQPAGIVHKGEFVMSKSATRAIGVGNLERMHTAAKRGYSGGGLVGGNAPRMAANAPQAPTISVSAPITIQGRNESTPEADAALSKRISRELEGTMRGVVTDELRRAQRPGNMLNNRRR